MEQRAPDFTISLQCICSDVHQTPDGIDFHLKLRAVADSSESVKCLKDKVFRCEEAFLKIYNSSSAQVGSHGIQVSSNRTEICCLLVAEDQGYLSLPHDAESANCESRIDEDEKGQPFSSSATTGDPELGNPVQMDEMEVSGTQSKTAFTGGDNDVVHKDEVSQISPRPNEKEILSGGDVPVGEGVHVMKGVRRGSDIEVVLDKHVQHQHQEGGRETSERCVTVKYSKDDPEVIVVIITHPDTPAVQNASSEDTRTRLHSYAKPIQYKCKHCSKSFSDARELLLHVKEHGDFNCDKCGKVFNLAVTLNNHILNHHSSIHVHICKKCKSGFIKEEDIQNHTCSTVEGNENELLKKEQFKCSICPKSFIKCYLLKHHLRLHQVGRIRSRLNDCDLCEKNFRNPGDLANHRRVHTGERKPYLCPVCGKGYASKKSVQTHVMIVHSKQKPFHCDVCNKAFVYHSQMYHHKKRHLGLRDFICDVCGKQFYSKNAMNGHRQMHEGRHTCNICGKRYRNISYLEIHKKTHSKKNLHQCPMCGDLFADPNYFKLHQKKFCKTILTHCKVCNLGFPNNKELTSHMGYHSGLRPYICETCGQAFAKASSLTDHTRMHNPETLIKCTTCGKGFTNQKGVRQHMARHHSSDKKRTLPRIASHDPGESSTSLKIVCESDSSLITETKNSDAFPEVAIPDAVVCEEVCASTSSEVVVISEARVLLQQFL